MVRDYCSHSGGIKVLFRNFNDMPYRYRAWWVGAGLPIPPPRIRKCYWAASYRAGVERQIRPFISVRMTRIESKCMQIVYKFKPFISRLRFEPSIIEMNDRISCFALLYREMLNNFSYSRFLSHACRAINTPSPSFTSSSWLDLITTRYSLG